MNKRLTEKQAKFLAQRIDDEARFAEEYYQSSECPDAEYAATFGYGEGEIELDRLDDEIRAKVEKLQSFMREKALLKVMTSVCELQLVDMYRVDNEVYSTSMGEVEYQLDDKLGKRLRSLSLEDRERVRKQMDEAYLGDSDYIYLSFNYDRWVMVLDPEKLEKKFEAIIRSEPSRKRARRRSAIQLRAQARAKAATLRSGFRLIVGGAA